MVDIHYAGGGGKVNHQFGARVTMPRGSEKQDLLRLNISTGFATLDNNEKQCLPAPVRSDGLRVGVLRVELAAWRGLAMADGCKVAERVRTYRERLQWTAEVLAEKSGVSASVIAAVEAGDVYPALGVLVKLSRALGQRLGTFMDDQYKPDPVIVRADARANELASHKACMTGGFHYFPLGRGKTDRHMEPFYIEIDASAVAPLSSHEGEEFIVVLSGTVEMVCGGVVKILKPGDSAYYNSVVQHLVKAFGGQPAAIYAVVFMPL